MFFLFLLKNKIPVRGRKLVAVHDNTFLSAVSLKNKIPVRGRKLRRDFIPCYAHLLQLKNKIPVRGRKLVARKGDDMEVKPS